MQKYSTHLQEVPITPIGGGETYCILWEQSVFITLTRYIVETPSQVHVVWHLSVLAESEITGGHRPFSVRFSHMTDQNLTCPAVMAAQKQCWLSFDH